MSSIPTDPNHPEERLAHNFFYRDGTPESARALLRSFLCVDCKRLDADLAGADESKRELAASQLFVQTLFFVRAAQKRRELVRVYEEVLLELDRDQRRHMFPILMEVGDESTWTLLREQAKKHGVDASNAYYGKDPRFERIAREPIKTANNLDIRWAVFMATGDRRPIVEIAGCLAMPDRIRGHIVPLLKPVSALSGLFSGKRKAQQKLIEGLTTLGIRLQAQTHAIVNLDDLDTFVVDGSPRGGQRLRALYDALPEPLPGELINEVMVKVSAMWSLAANAAEHPGVMEVCELAASKFEGHGRLNLLEVLTRAHMTRGDFTAAQTAMKAWIAANPTREELPGQLESLELERRFAAAAGLEEAVREDMSVESGAETARATASRLAQAPSYHARAQFVRHAPPTSEEEVTRSQWQGRYALHRAHVSRGFWTRKDDGLADEWADIDGQRYIRGPGVWIRQPKELPLVGNSAALETGPWRSLLTSRPPDRAAGIAGSTFVELSYDRADVGEHIAKVYAPAEPVNVTLRIDTSTSWLAEVAVESLVRDEATGFSIVYRFVRAEPPLVIEVANVVG